MEFKTWTFDKDQIIQTMNQSKEITVGALITEGLLSEEEGKKFLKQYAIIMVQRKTLGEWIESVLFRNIKEKGIGIYRVVKIVSDEELDTAAIDELIK